VQALGRQRLCCSANFVALRLRATLAQGLDLYAPMAHRGAHASFSPYHVPTHTPSGTSNPSQSDGFVAVWAAPKLPALPAARLARPPVARDPGRDPRPSPRRRREGAITLADLQGMTRSAVWGTSLKVRRFGETLDAAEVREKAGPSAVKGLVPGSRRGPLGGAVRGSVVGRTQGPIRGEGCMRSTGFRAA